MWIKLLHISCFALLFSLTVSGQNDGAVEVAFMKKKSSVKPGKMINFPVVVRNNTSESKQISLELKLPAGWRSILEAVDFSLAPGKSKVQLFSVQAPLNASVDEHTVEVVAVDQQNETPLGYDKTSVELEEVIDLELSLVEAPQYVMAGEEMSALVRVENRGNTAQNVFLETMNCSLSGDASFRIEAGTSKEIEVTATTNREQMVAQNSFFVVRALVGQKMWGSVNRSYTVFPVHKEKRDLYFRYPIKLSMSFLTTNTSGAPIQALQLEAEGRGFLDVGKVHYLEFLARGPDNRRLGFMGLYDQYYAKYVNEKLGLTVGEQSYRFTDLTESSRFGLGAEVAYLFGSRFTLGALYVKPRYYTDIKDEFAVYAGFKWDRDNELKVHAIRKKSVVGTSDANLLSLSGELQPFEYTDVEFEFSAGESGGDWDKAFRAGVSSRISFLRFTGIYNFTGKNYPGYYNNSKFYSGNLSARLFKDMDLSFFAREDFKNARLDTFFLSAPYSKSYQASLNYRMGRQMRTRLFWRESIRKDRLALDKFDYQTRTWNLELSNKVRRWNYSLLGEYGKAFNFQLADSINMQETYRLSGSLGYNLAGKHLIRLFANWSNLNSFIAPGQQNLNSGIAISSTFSKSLKASLYLQNAYAIDDYYKNRNLMQATLDYTFFRRHTIGLRSYYTIFRRQTENPDFSAALTYSYNLGIPLKQVLEAGDLKGTITYDDGSPVKGVVVSFANQKEVTNERGEFVFLDVEPGDHLLFIDNDKMEVDELPSVPLPAKVEIMGNQESSLNLVIHKGVKVSGRFAFTEDLDEEVELGGIVLELSGSFDRYRIASSEDGSFAFPLVRPGKYLLKIFQSTVPEGYLLNQSVIQLNLKPGEKVQLHPEIRKKKRNIVFSSKGFVLTPNGTVKLDNNAAEKLSSTLPEANHGIVSDKKFYSIQIGAFRRAKTRVSRYFERRPYDFELEREGLHRYYIGRFQSFAEAKSMLPLIHTIYRDAFIVYLSEDANELVPEHPENTEVFYSVQIGAFRNRKNNSSRFFKSYPYDFERFSHNLYKYFIGKFSSLREAKEMREKLSKLYSNPFVVVFNDGEIKPVY